MGSEDKVLIYTGSNQNNLSAVRVFNRFCYRVNGGISLPDYCDGNNTYTWMHVDPSTAITTDEAQAGSMSGIYKYFYTEYNANSSDGDFWTGHETNPSPVYTTANLSSKKVVLTLPATAENTGFTHLKIYSTDAGGSTYYYIGNVAVGTTTYDDDADTRDTNLAWGELSTASDGTVTQTDLNYAIKNHKYIEVTNTRIFAAGIKVKNDGTLSVTSGSPTITGISTDFNRSVVGDYLQVDGDSQTYEIDTYTSATSLDLKENYAGSTDSGVNYEIKGFGDVVRWSGTSKTVTHSGKPLPWTWPASYHRRIVSSDKTPIMGLCKIGNQPIVAKKYSHYLLTENGDDYIDNESITAVGTCSHWSMCETDFGSVIMMTAEGKIYETNGLSATDLNIDLDKTVDGIEDSRLEYAQAIWWSQKKWYMLIYTSSGGTENDRMLIYDYELKQWVIWQLGGGINAIGLVESSGTVTPWIGTVGGFVYKLMTGNNFGAGTSGTVSGTITSAGAATITDSSASFNTTDDGHEDVYVAIYDTNDDFQEEQQIASNTGTVLTVDTNWSTTPTVGYSYYIGDIRWYWKSKVFDFGQNAAKSINSVLINFKKVSASRNVKIRLYVSEDPDTVGDSLNQSVTFDISQNFNDPLGFYPNTARYFQFEIWGHGNADPVTVNNIVFEIQQHMR